MKHNPVGWFEIPVVDMERAISFYEGVFGVELSRNTVGDLDMAWFPMVDDAPQAAGSLVKHPLYAPSRDGVLVYFTAPDIPATLERVRAAGGEVLQERQPIGEHGFVGLFVDSEGNRVAVHSRS